MEQLLGDRGKLVDSLQRISAIERDTGLTGFRILTQDALAGRLSAVPLGTFGVVDSVLAAAEDIKSILNRPTPHVVYAPPSPPSY